MAIPGSSEVTAGDDALASDYNKLRRDVMEIAGDYAAAGGSSNAFTVSLDSAIDSYQAGLIIKFEANHTISGSPTVNVNSLGAKSLIGQARTLDSLQIQSGDKVLALYDGTDFIMLSAPRRPIPFYSFPYNGWPGVVGSASNQNSAAYTDDERYLMMKSSTAYNFMVWDARGGGDTEEHSVTTEWASADSIIGFAKIGDYLYIGMTDTATQATRVYRYAANDIATGGTQMTISTLGTTAVPDRMICDGENLYFNQDGGDTATSAHIWEKFTISGTTMTSTGKTTCGASDSNFSQSVMDALGNFYGFNTTGFLRRYDSSGTLQATWTTDEDFSLPGLAWVVEGYPYFTRRGPTATDVIFFHLLSLLP